MNINLYNDNCLEIMKNIPDKSIDFICADLPYGTTTCSWDSIIDLDKLWEQYNRIIVKNGAIVLFCQQPFTTQLISSNINDFKYMWYWKKTRPCGYTNAKLKPLKDIEEIAVFSKGKTANGSENNMKYNPQGLIEVNKKWKRPKKYGDGKGVNTTRESQKLERLIKYTNYPRQILEYAMHNNGLLHPTQKPLELLEFLIKTYTDEGGVVLDNTMGSGTSGVACKNLNRDFIGIELDEKYFNIAKERINE